jgi:uncharacterized protein GlcG (DUF336 family)
LLSASRTLGSAAARRIVEAAIAEAERGGWRIAVAVVDPSGLPIALARMDEVTPPILDFAQDKAYTAATMRRSTEAFFGRMTSAPTLAMGFQNRPRLMVWGGGLPIFHEGLAVGGVGVSGAKEAEDVACARAGIAAIGLGWEG